MNWSLHQFIWYNSYGQTILHTSNWYEHMVHAVLCHHFLSDKDHHDFILCTVWYACTDHGHTYVLVDLLCISYKIWIKAVSPGGPSPNKRSLRRAIWFSTPKSCQSTSWAPLTRASLKIELDWALVRIETSLWNCSYIQYYVVRELDDDHIQGC